MARDNGRRGAYLHAGNARKERARQLEQEEQFSSSPLPTTLQDQLPTSSNPFSSSNNTYNDRSQLTCDGADGNEGEEDVTPPNLVGNGNGNAGFTPPPAALKFLLSLSPNTVGNLDSPTVANIISSGGNSSKMSTTDRFFEQAPDELNARFPVCENNDNNSGNKNKKKDDDYQGYVTVPGPWSPDYDSEQHQHSIRRRTTDKWVVGTYLDSSPLASDAANVPIVPEGTWLKQDKERKPKMEWVDMLYILGVYIVFLVLLACFSVIILDGLNWMGRTVWGRFCRMMGWLLMLDY